MAVTINGSTGITIPTGVFADSSGNVGIGTTSPAWALDVSSAQANMRLTSATGTNNTLYRAVNTGGTFYSGLDNSTGSSFGAAYSGVMWHSGAYPLVFGTNNTERMRIDTSGNLAMSGGGAITSGKIIQGTSQASTSGVSITFTGIPSWAKRITVMFNAVSTNGTSNILVQIGSGSTTTSGYYSACWASNTTNTNSTAGFLVTGLNAAAYLQYGVMILNNFSGNTWVGHTVTGEGATATSGHGGGVSPTLGGALDRVIITTVNGTDTFDAGSINILYE
jgi:hypothetical protein